MHTVFNLDHGIKVAWNIAQYPLHHLSYAPAKFEVDRRHCIYKKVQYLTFDSNICLYHVTYAPANFEVATSKDWEDALTGKCITWPLTLGSRSHNISPSTIYIMWPKEQQSLKLLRTLFDLWPWGQGHMKCCPVPSSSCDLCSYKVLSCYSQGFRRRYNYKKPHAHRHILMHWQTDDGLTLVRN